MSPAACLAGMLLTTAFGGTNPPPATCVEPGYCWLAPEDFTDRGGWKLDTQFIHLTGSSHLIAAGILEPVDDAWAEAAIAESGRYRVWVRMRDWLPAHHPGRFQVSVNDRRLPHVLGEAGRPDWHWAIAGDADIEKGTARVGLHDLTGGYGRCAAILFTSAMDYVPPYEKDRFVRERARFRGTDTTPRDLGRFDVIVVGGGPAGCPAAIAAARMGARTALFQDRPVLGGNASTELCVPPNGASINHPNARETGIIEEASRLHADGGYHGYSEPFRILAEAEGHLTVHLNTRIIGVDMASPSRIRGVLGVDVSRGSYVRAEAPYVIDCTGDGWVGHYAGARYRVGREAKSEYGEADAPAQPDNVTMSGCLMGGKEGGLVYEAYDAGGLVAYTPPPWAAKLPDIAANKRPPTNVTWGEWWLEHPGYWDDLYNAEEARDELLRITYGYWDYVKNVWDERGRAANLQLGKVAFLNAKRETRRLIGDYVLTQNDILEGRTFDDAIAYAGWPLDIHAPEGIYGGPDGPYFTSHTFAAVRQIPFSILYSQNIENLLFAGRCVSVTHLALGTVRVERTLATLGQAAGTAAALCVRHGCDPRTLRARHTAELQQALLKYDQYIPGRTNQDPDDLARSAAVTASSVASGQAPTPTDAGEDCHDLTRHRRGCLLPVMGLDRIDRARLLLRSGRTETATVCLHVRQAATLDDFSSTEDLVVAEACIAPGERWVEFDLSLPIETDYVWLWLDAVEGMAWRLSEAPFPWARRAYASREADDPDAWMPMSGRYVCSLEPASQAWLDYSPRNVINGWSRCVGSAPNMWRSAPGAAMPQWLELSFEQPIIANTVHVTFATDLNSIRLAKAEATETEPAALAGVSDYEIHLYDGVDWRVALQVEGNIQRWRRHRFETATIEKLRLVVKRAAHMDSAQVYELRVYHE